MSKDRVIHLLSDEEISLILTSLRFSEQKYIKQDDFENLTYIRNLYDKIDISEDVGVIGSERI